MHSLALKVQLFEFFQLNFEISYFFTFLYVFDKCLIWNTTSNIQTNLFNRMSQVLHKKHGIVSSVVLLTKYKSWFVLSTKNIVLNSYPVSVLFKAYGNWLPFIRIYTVSQLTQPRKKGLALRQLSKSVCMRPGGENQTLSYLRLSTCEFKLNVQNSIVSQRIRQSQLFRFPFLSLLTE